MIIDADTVTLVDLIYSDSSDFGTHVYSIQDVMTVHMNNSLVVNISATGSFFDDFFYFSMLDGGSIFIDNISFNNVNVGIQYGFRFRGIVDYLSITNSNFTD